jgi:two-component system nitrate/nitrite response regulator NarL
VSTAGSRLRVLVADDHPLYLAAVADAINSRDELELSGEAADGHEALAAIRSREPDVAVVDVGMPALGGFALLHAVLREDLATRVLLLAPGDDAALVHAAIDAGAAGCLFKNTDACGLCEAIIAIGRGETVFAPGVGGETPQRAGSGCVPTRPLLTPREREVLRHLATGLSAPGIAERLVLSPATVRTHLQHIYDKLGVRGRAAAVAEAMRRGILH